MIGTPWRSGLVPESTAEAGAILDRWDAMRGVASRGATIFIGYDAWRTLWAGPAITSGALESLVARRLKVTISLGLLARPSLGDFAGLAQGNYDYPFQKHAEVVLAAGCTDPIFRLGWEMTHSSWPWSLTHCENGDYTNAIRGWRRIAQLIRRFIPDAKFEWNHIRRPSIPLDQIWPGGDVVSMVGVDLYDGWPTIGNVGGVDKWLHLKLDNGNPAGLLSWAEWAHAKGKRLAVSEWGCRADPTLGGDAGSGGDDPQFVETMHSCFHTLHAAGMLVGEAYFNRKEHKLLPETILPQSRKAYLRLWSGQDARAAGSLAVGHGYLSSAE